MSVTPTTRPMIGSTHAGRSAPKASAARPSAATTEACPSASSQPRPTARRRRRRAPRRRAGLRCPWRVRSPQRLGGRWIIAVCCNKVADPTVCRPLVAARGYDAPARGDGRRRRIHSAQEDGGTMRMWGGRFATGTDPLAADFTRSIEVDRALAADDLRGSIAHVHGLARAGLVTAVEEAELVGGLEALTAEVAAGRFAWDPALEDVHLNLEAALGERLGPVAAKLHTGRSRNDQVALDLRLWLRRTLGGGDAAIVELERALVGRAERDGEAGMPGMTPIQPAQTGLLAHHLLGYVERLERDRGRFADARRRLNVSPLGSGALAGAGYPLDREATARELRLDGATANSHDAVSDRDFVVEVLAAVALSMVHLSRFAEEITWWSNPAFGFVRVADAFSN